MSRTQSLKIVDPKNKEIWAPCGNCGTQTAHIALSQVDTGDEFSGGNIQVWAQRYTIQCAGCKTVSFCKESQCSEDLDYNEMGESFCRTTQEVFPSRIAGRPLLADYYYLPHGVANIYEQTHTAISNKQSILAGIGLRAIIEAICIEKNTQGRTLLNKIDDLVNQGIITRDGGTILHTIRLLGNESAHEVKANSEDELATALEVVENLVSSVYIIPEKAKKIKKT